MNAVLFFLGCASGTGVSGGVQWVAEDAPVLPPPSSLTVDAPWYIEDDDEVEFRVLGAEPGDTIHLYGAFHAADPWCPEPLDGACVANGPPEFVTHGVADADGVVTIRHRLDVRVSGLMDIHAAFFDGDDLVVSESVEVTVTTDSPRIRPWWMWMSSTVVLAEDGGLQNPGFPENFVELTLREQDSSCTLLYQIDDLELSDWAPELVWQATITHLTPLESTCVLDDGLRDPVGPLSRAVSGLAMGPFSDALLYWLTYVDPGYAPAHWGGAFETHPRLGGRYDEVVSQSADVWYTSPEELVDPDGTVTPGGYTVYAVNPIWVGWLGL